MQEQQLNPQQQSSRSDCWRTMRVTRTSLLYLIAVTMVFFVGSFYYMDARNHAWERRQAKMLAYQSYRNTLVNNQRPNVRVYDLRKKLDQAVADSLECRKTAEYQTVSTTLCLYDKDKDVVSKALWLNGLWEEHIMSNLE